MKAYPVFVVIALMAAGAGCTKQADVERVPVGTTVGFEDAMKQGIARAHKTLRNVRSAWVKEQHVRVRDEAITEYQVNMMVTFVIDD
jgi:hypothetical protein